MVTWPWSRKKWYAGVICGRCGGYVQWVEDPSRGKVKLISEPGRQDFLDVPLLRFGGDIHV